MKIFLKHPSAVGNDIDLELHRPLSDFFLSLEGANESVFVKKSSKR